ncbi:Protease HtpX [Symmachiella dynata]|uniref:Protease HtpX n=1 Tax=Symmachiella dynata TaxID=2527995 RepID=A0A517ZYR8_9PLAN|nr:Protease HtpX [Symmachiella dynata]
MSFQAKCPECAAVFKVAPELAGKKRKCPKCSSVFTLPTPRTSPKSIKAQTTQSRSDPAATAQRRTNGKKKTPATTDPARWLNRAFRGDIKPVRRSIVYRFGILLVTIVMVVLPLLYVALIGLTGYAVYYHAVNHTGMLGAARGRGMIMVFLVYLAPLVIGGILVLFMIKPLFARPAKHVRRRSLTNAGEPLIFALVERICEVVGAPQPRRIDIDYELNASARFRRGWLSFFGSDLVLTIGIPLAAGLSARQLTGVLAHEFGHFSQGVGMRLTYIVRNVNGWFARVVYERDEWDEWLAETASEVDFRIGWILLLSQLCVAITRGVLWFLMLVGHAVSGFMLRQMEYDADRYETRVAGSETFAETSHRIRQLGVAYGLTQQAVVGLLNQGLYPDDLAKVMLKMGDELTPKALRQIKQSGDEEKTGIFDTHPCDKDRIASSEREKAPGIFHVDGPASKLFQNFEGLSKNVTWDLYRDIGSPIKPQNMDPVEKLFEKEEEPTQPSVETLPPIPFD